MLQHMMLQHLTALPQDYWREGAAAGGEESKRGLVIL